MGLPASVALRLRQSIVGPLRPRLTAGGRQPTQQSPQSDFPCLNPLSHVLYLFVDAAATAQTDTFIDPVLDRPASCAPDTASNNLLGLVRRLVAHGKTLIARLRAQPGPNPPEIVALHFGTRTLTLIMARILRGLMLAAALERRVMQSAARIDDPPAPPVRRTDTRPADPADEPPRKRAAKRRTGHRNPTDSSLLDGLPTPGEIAALIRGRRIGDVLIDICHDLGITAAHPLWRALQPVILLHGGTPGALQRDLMARTLHRGLRRAGRQIGVYPKQPRRRAARRRFGTGPP